MRSFRFAVLAVAASVAVLTTAPVAAQDSDFSWRGSLRAGQTIEIKGINGEIAAMPASGNEVRVTAVKREGRRGDAEDVVIEVVNHDGGATICAVYPDSRERNVCAPGRGGRLGARNNDTRVEFRVEVPSHVRFSATNVNGKVTARDLVGNVAASTVNGAVEVSTAGLASARSVNGSIEVSMDRANWDGELEFETVNGSIEVTIGDNDLHTDVRASTVNGSISTDWPLTIQGRFGPKRLNGTIGNGGRTLSLSTVNGSISLIRK